MGTTNDSSFEEVADTLRAHHLDEQQQQRNHERDGPRARPPVRPARDHARDRIKCSDSRDNRHDVDSPSLPSPRAFSGKHGGMWWSRVVAGHGVAARIHRRMRVFVCGGRPSSDGDRVFRMLDALHTRHGFTALIEDARDEGRPPAEGNFNAGKEPIHPVHRWRLKLRRKIGRQPSRGLVESPLSEDLDQRLYLPCAPGRRHFRTDQNHHAPKARTRRGIASQRTVVSPRRIIVIPPYDHSRVPYWPELLEPSRKIRERLQIRHCRT